MAKLINISEVSKIVNLIDPITKKPLNHIVRYWEKEFKEIRPRKINNRRFAVSSGYCNYVIWFFIVVFFHKIR